MEDAPLWIRLMAAGAALVITVALSPAQTDAAPGKPMQLLPNVKPAAAAAAVKKVNVKRRRKRLVKGTTRKPTHSTAAARNETQRPTHTATAAAPTNVWPLQTTGANRVLLPDAAKPSEPSELVLRGQTVQVKPADAINAIDLAADKPKAALATANAAAVPKPMVAALIAAPAPAKTSPVGSAAWIAQVLGALAGAMATGWLAWLLIGPAPRTSR
jgi:hypothetical protein